MKDKQFDRIIRDKLDGLRPAYDPSDWELFEQQLDQEETGTPVAEDRVIDQVVFEKLHGLELPYQPEHWRQFSSRLENAFQLERTLIRYKLMELAFLLLLLFVFFQYFRLPSAGPVAPSGLPALEENQRPPVQANASEVTPAEDGAGNAESRPAGAALPPREAAPGPDHSHASGVSDNRGASDVRATAPERQQLHASPLIPGSNRDGLLPGEPLVKPQLQLAVPQGKWHSLPFLNLPAPGPFAYDTNLDLPVKLLANPSRSQMLVSMFGGPDYNRVRTPGDTLSNGQYAEGLDRYTLGYNGGITLGFEMGRWEVETGAIYAAKVYRPRQVLYLLGTLKSGYYGEGVRDIELNTLQVPVNVRYHFLRHRNWRAYALAGFSLQVAFQANYYVADQNAFDDAPFLAPPGEGFQPSQPSPLDNKNLSGGWFEGGTFEENAYLTGNLGFGVERYLSHRWSIFTQPTYQHSIDYFIQGLGPDRDRINTMSIFWGVRVRL